MPIETEEPLELCFSSLVLFPVVSCLSPGLDLPELFGSLRSSSCVSLLLGFSGSPSPPTNRRNVIQDGQNRLNYDLRLMALLGVSVDIQCLDEVRCLEVFRIE